MQIPQELPRYRRSFIDGPDVLSGWIAENLPDFWEQSAAVGSFVVLGTWKASTAEIEDQALSIVINQATNDLLDLVVSLRHAQGRPAIRAARAMFEHLVTALDLIADPSLSTRYIAHADVVELIELSDDRPLAALPPKAKRSAQHARRKKRRDIKPRAQSALDTFGRDFKRSWAGQTLRTRAERHGLVADYDMYSVLSAVIHGTAHGADSTLIEVDGRTLHRTGGAMLDAPVGMFYGLTYFRGIVEAVTRLLFDPTPSVELLAALDALLACLFDYSALMSEGHIGVSPTVVAPNQIAALRLSALGGRQWWVHLPEARLIRRAIAPDSDEFPRIEETIRELLKDAPSDPESWTEAIMIAVAGVRLRVEPGTKWLPAGQVLIQNALGGSVQVQH